MKPRPKFCVGEEVAVVSQIHPSFNCERTEIEEMEFSEYGEDVLFANSMGTEDEPMWYYGTSAFPDALLDETFLRKLPPPDRLQWSDCEWQPDREEEKCS